MGDQRSNLENVYSWVRENTFKVDAIFAGILVALLGLLPQLGVGERHFARFGLSLFLLVPLAWRRIHPVASAGSIVLVSLLQLIAYHRPVPADTAAVLGLYAVAAYGPRWAGRAGLSFGVFGATVAAFQYTSFSTSYAPIIAGFAITLMLSAWALGMLSRLRLRDEDRLIERARLLELERDQERRLAATAERARIAREMHDVVAHSLSVTISQADGGQYAARSDPQAAVAALETISATGRQALADMRSLLGVLRQDEGRQLAPQPDTDTIPDLIEQVRSGGLAVSLEIVGRAYKLAPGPALAAYRIVQESLTNVLKHAGPTSQAWVRLSWRPTALEVSVLDDGRGAGAVGASTDGQGLLGMTERATLHGGTLEAGPRPGGGFGVRAVLPYGGSR